MLKELISLGVVLVGATAYVHTQFADRETVQIVALQIDDVYQAREAAIAKEMGAIEERERERPLTRSELRRLEELRQEQLRIRKLRQGK